MRNVWIKFVEGKRHDAAMLVDSGLLRDLEHYAHVDGRPMCVYGEPAYPDRVHLQAPFRNCPLTAEMEARRYSKLFQIFGFQKESEDWPEQCW